jgi:copper transport protein
MKKQEAIVMIKDGIRHGDSRLRFAGTVMRALMVCVLFWLAAASFAGHAYAHAVLEKTTPAADSRLDISPAYVELLFNERLDTGGARLLVLDESSRNVADDQLEFIGQGTGVRLPLPRLDEGHYTVSYSVISADGHPVSGAYVFTVGNPAALPDGNQLDSHQQVGHGHAESDLTARVFVLYAARILYYAGLLIVAGLLFWSMHRSASPLVRDVRDQALGLAGKFAVIATLAYVFLSLQDLGEGEPLSEWGRIMIETTIGRLYIVELLLAFAAPLLPMMGLAARLLWAYAALLVEAWSGHAAVYSPIAYTVGLDLVHLAAASVWSGGLVLLFAIWMKERPEAGRFALLFSKWALISFFLLWITGLLATMNFLPSLEYLRFTPWGSWLIAKVILSVIVAGVAFLIRIRLKKGDLPQGILLKVDLGLLAAIVLSVGVLTYQTPVPPNEPLHFHKMGTEMHVTLVVTPNSPGVNEFTVKIWLPETVGQGKPKNVQLRMLPTERSDVGFIDVPLRAYSDEELDGFPGFTKTTYRAEGPYLPFAGEWKAQVRVTDAQDNERVVETVYRIY